MAAESLNNGKENEEQQSNHPNRDLSRNPWETGLRRRRRDGMNATASRTGEGDERGQNDVTTHHGNIGPSGGTAGSENQNSGFISGASCGNGAVSTLSAGAQGPRLGASQLTPYKTPTKEPMLVPVTPSTETLSGDTVESTAISSPQSTSRNLRATQSLGRQYQLLESQAYLLLGTTFFGFFLFLIFALPFFAFVGLALMAASLAALGPVASSAIRARYQIELEHPMGLLRYLPDSIRVLLTETTLHEFMTDTTFMMENRYLLLYFIPGLQPDQLMNYINQLPQRHRDALLQPGLGRLMPSLMERFVRMDNLLQSDGGGIQLLQNEGRGDMSTASQLTMDREENENDEIGIDSDFEVTLIEAITSLRQTLTGQTNNFALATIREESPLMDVNTPGVVGEGDDSNAESTPGRVVVVLPPQSSGLGTQNNEQQNVQEEYDTEGRILSEAASTAVAGYSAQASEAVSETAAGAVENISSLFIRLGSLTGVLAGSGSVALAAYMHRPFSVTLGLFGMSQGNTARSDAASANTTSRRGNGIMYGLLATSAVGFVSAGLSYAIRNRVRQTIANNRGARGNKSLEPPKEKDMEQESGS